MVWIGIDAPARRGARPTWRAYGWALATVVAATAVGQAMFGRFDEANLVMVYLLGLVPVAVRGDRGAAVVAAVLSVLAFDWFFVPPYYSFAVSDTQYLFTFAVMGLVGLALASLTAQLAARVVEAQSRERRARALYALSRALLATHDPATVMAEGARVIGLELKTPVGAWLKSPGGEPLPAAEPAAPLNASELELLRWVMKEGAPAGPGTETFPGARYLLLPVQTARQVHGALAIRLEAGAPAEVRETLETGANQLAIALEQARARAEADAAAAQAEAERARSALLSAVSHDLRTPLAGIVGAAGSLAEGAEALDAATRRELAEGIEEEAERLNRLVTNLLHATRLDAGAAELRREWTPLEEVIAPALSRLGRALEAHPVTLELPSDLPLAFVDPVLLTQVFVNLLENAAKYTPAGTPIRVKAGHEAGQLVVVVEDEGPGLPEGEEARAFDKFRRYDRGGAPGAGLGLAIVRGVIEAHGGTITAGVRPGGGARFTFSLPSGGPLVE